MRGRIRLFLGDEVSFVWVGDYLNSHLEKQDVHSDVSELKTDIVNERSKESTYIFDKLIF